MITSAVLAGYALLVGAASPRYLARARWTHRAPALAVGVWLLLMLTFVVSTALAAHHLVMADRHVHGGLIGLLSACGLGPHGTLADSAADPDVWDAAGLAAAGAVVALPLVWLLRTARTARAERRRQLDTLRLIGRPAPAYGATVVEHPVAAVYCLPARPARVVVTRGALDALDDEQLRAALAHERAHIDGRHHLVQMLLSAFARAFPRLPLARHAREQVLLLLEMVADDRALRLHSREALATALCEVAAGRVPRPALGMGGPSALIRLRRVLTPQPRPHGAARLGVALAAAGAPLFPLLLGCGPF
ncbi:M56 family metallopeptidase [Streptomyces sp. NPDC048659]|uniref:M56 family metallopeptidase n=1 Tax=Streptomyces sp. NPDC048659 TaxID=3155489 RepID=UPI0034145079